MAENKKFRGGSITNDERKFILENMNTMSLEDISKHLNRNPAVVDKCIKSHNVLPQADNVHARQHLRKSVFWKHLKDEFTTDELNYIEDQYIKYVQQFQENIVATEEVQVLALIKVEVLQQRNLKGKQKIGENAERYQMMAKALIDKVGGNFADLDEKTREQVMELQNNVQACMNAESARTSEYLELQKQHNELTKKVMGSRDQRIQEIMNTKTNFASYIKQLIERDKQDSESRGMELGRLASEKELLRLSQLHVFADNSQDNPVLTSDVLEQMDKQDKEDQDAE